MAADKDYEIKVCTFPFWCKCGKLVRVGENYIVMGGVKLCMNEIPAPEERKLIPIASKLPRDPFHNLRIENLKMRLDLEIISEDPQSKAARKIMARYRRLIRARREKELINKN